MFRLTNVIFIRLQPNCYSVLKLFQMRMAGTHNLVPCRIYFGIPPWIWFWLIGKEKNYCSYLHSIWVREIDSKINRLISYQCKRSVCKKADKPSIKTNIAMVSTLQKAKMTHKQTPPYQLSMTKAWRNTISHNTSANSVLKNWNKKKMHTFPMFDYKEWREQSKILHELTSMSKGQGPQTKIGCCMRNWSQHIFNSMNSGMNEDLRNIFFIVAMASVLHLWTSNTITIQTTLSITIANWLTIDWMVLRHVKEDKIKENG